MKTMNDKGIMTVGYPKVLVIIGTHCRHAMPKKNTLAIFVLMIMMMMMTMMMTMVTKKMMMLMILLWIELF